MDRDIESEYERHREDGEVEQLKAEVDRLTRIINAAYREDSGLATWADELIEDELKANYQEWLNQTMVEHSEDDSGWCRICGTLWPCRVWVAAREEWDEADHA